MMRLSRTVVFVSCVVTTITVSSFAIFPQLGPHPVSISNLALQTFRDDALSPQKDEKRRLMLSVFQPQMSSLACANASHVAYMPEKTARIMEKQEPGGVPLSQVPGLDFAALEVEYCALARDDGPAAETHSPLPIVLFQPGYQASRFAYQLYLAAIASSGYVVVSIDITYECPIVEFKDGSMVVNNTGVSPDGLGPNESLPVRAQDFSSVIDAIENGSLPVSRSRVQDNNDGQGNTTAKIGVFGHSIGGAASLFAASLDPRISAVIDWDGQIFSAQVNATSSTPTMLFQRESPLEGHVEGWEYAWENLLRSDTKAWIALNGTQHLSFTDLPTVIETEGLRNTGNRDGVLAVGGVIAPRRLVGVVWTWSVVWFDRVLKGKKDKLFFGDKLSAEFPDVRFIK